MLRQRKRSRRLYLAVGEQAQEAGPLPDPAARDGSYDGALLLGQLAD